MVAGDMVGRGEPSPRSEPLPHVFASVLRTARQHQQGRRGEPSPEFLFLKVS